MKLIERVFLARFSSDLLHNFRKYGYDVDDILNYDRDKLSASQAERISSDILAGWSDIFLCDDGNLYAVYAPFGSPLVWHRAYSDRPFYTVGSAELDLSDCLLSNRTYDPQEALALARMLSEQSGEEVFVYEIDPGSEECINVETVTVDSDGIVHYDSDPD